MDTKIYCPACDCLVIIEPESQTWQEAKKSPLWQEHINTEEHVLNFKKFLTAYSKESTTMTLDKVRAYLEERLIAAREDVIESIRVAPNSYGAGYDQGELAILSEILALVNGELE